VAPGVQRVRINARGCGDLLSERVPDEFECMCLYWVRFIEHIQNWIARN
jgi:hypothetical protein